MPALPLQRQLSLLVHIPEVLTPDQVRYCRNAMDRANWIDGRVTAGHQSVQVKRNLQLPEGGAEARDLGDMILTALGGNSLFMSAVLPKTVFPPLFNRYDADGEMNFGSHVDNAIRTVPGTGVRVRTDVSSTLFLSDPDEYDGGELVVEDTYGAHSVKLPAGDMIVYPGTSLHHVTKVTRGSRLASFFWTESMIADVTRRSMMFDLDMSIIRLNSDHPDHPSVVSLTSLYHNLLRQWVV
jgi:PKHD-type hydroxylase